MLGQLSLRLLLLLQRLTSRIDEALDMWIFTSHIVCHICCDKQLANVKFFATDIIGIKSDKIDTRDIHTTMSQHPHLVGNILGINLHLVFLGTFIVFRSRTALHFIDGITASCLTENIHGTITALEGKRRLTDILRTIAETLLRLVEHRFQVECAISLERGDLNIVAKEVHGKVAHLVASLETGGHLWVFYCQFRMIHT